MNSENISSANGGKDLVHKCISDPGRATLDGGEEDDRARRHRSATSTTSDTTGGSSAAAGPATSRKCVLTLDGYSYVIVASPPSSISGSCGGSGSHERRVVTVRDDNVAVGPPVTARTRVQLPKQGSLTIVRRSSNSGGRRSPSATSGVRSGGLQRFSPPTSVEVESVNSPTSSSFPPPLAMAIAPGDTDAAGTVNLAADNLPAVDTPDACDKAALRLRGLLCQLQSGEVSAQVLQRNLQYAARVLEAVYIDETRQNSSRMDATPSPQENATQTSPTCSAAKQTQTQQHGVLLHQQSVSTGGTTVPAVPQKRRLREPVWARRLADEDDELSEVQPDAVPPEVREWLASTFTRQQATTRRRADEKPKFRSVAHAIRAGIFVDRMYRRVGQAALMQFPCEVARVLKHLDDWCFDVFALSEASGGQPVKYLGYDLLNRYGIIHKFKVPPAVLEAFLVKVEEGYCKYGNPYHNNIHAADVSQTVHFMLCQTGLMNWMTDLEIFATLIAALIHDFEHTGTTNNFHVMSGTEVALLYNDRAVLENHHLSLAFRLMKDEDSNVAQNLSREEYREFRTLIIDMVLATDMSCHFQQLKNMRNLLSLAEPSIDKSKALSMVLHTCDISHPSKIWSLHKRWTTSLLEEFFRQGDMENALGLPFSPLCDRNNTLVAESQIGFIEFIVEPSMSLCGDMLEAILAPPEDAAGGQGSNTSSAPSSAGSTDSRKNVSSTPPPTANSDFKIPKPWVEYLAQNKAVWKEQAAKDAELREQQKKEEEESQNEEKETSAEE